MPKNGNVCVCVLPTGVSFLIVPDLRHASWPLRKGCHPSLYPAFPLEVLHVASFLSFFPQWLMRQNHHVIGYDQASLSVLCLEQIWWSSPHRYALCLEQIWWSSPHRYASIIPRYRLCQTKKCLRPSSKATSHSSSALARPLSSRFFNLSFSLILLETTKPVTLFILPDDFLQVYICSKRWYVSGGYLQP